MTFLRGKNCSLLKLLADLCFGSRIAHHGPSGSQRCLGISAGSRVFRSYIPIPTCASTLSI
jgi:hypothetical protein